MVLLKWFFVTATFLDVEELYKAVDKMHRTEGDIFHSQSSNDIFENFGIYSES